MGRTSGLNKGHIHVLYSVSFRKNISKGAIAKCCVMFFFGGGGGGKGYEKFLATCFLGGGGGDVQP